MHIVNTETKRYLLILLADEGKRNRKGREEVAAQLHDPHRVTLRTRGALHYLLNIYLPTYGLSILFLNRSNVKKVHDRLYYFENGGRSVCGTAAIGGQQRPASPEKKEVLFLFKHTCFSPT